MTDLREDQAMPLSVGIIHVHTAYSHDGRDSIGELSEWAMGRGLSFVAITDHAEDLDAVRWEELVADCRTYSTPHVTMIPGLEFRFEGFAGLHLLACGLREWIAPTTPQEFIGQTRETCGLTVGAHPVIWRRPCPPDVLVALDAIEVWNGGYNTRYLPDPSAMALARMLHREGRPTVATVGPDQHDRRNDKGLRIVTRAAPRDSLRAIRDGHFRNVGRTMHIPARIESGAMALGLLRVARVTLDSVSRSQEALFRWARRVRRVLSE